MELQSVIDIYNPNQDFLQCSSHGSLLLVQTATHLLSSLLTSCAGDIFSPVMYSDPLMHLCLLDVAKAQRGVTALNPPVPLPIPPTTTYIKDRFYSCIGKSVFAILIHAWILTTS